MAEQPGSVEQVPTTPNGATVPTGAPVSKETPGIESPTTPPVEPEIPTTVEKSQREIELEAALEEERSKKAEARKDAEKKRRQLTEERKGAGKFEELYNEEKEAAVTLAIERDNLKGENETLRTQLKAAEKENSDFRASLLQRFQPDDLPIAESLPTSKLFDYYEQRYSKPLLAHAPPSLGIQKPGGAKPLNNWRDLPPAEQIRIGLNSP